MLGFEILQVRLQHAKEEIDIIRRRGNLETTLVGSSIAKLNPQPELFRDEIDSAQAKSELRQKAAQNKQQRFGGFDFVFKLKTFVKTFRRLNELQQPHRLAAGVFPKANRVTTEADADLLFIEPRKIAKGVNSPFVEESDDGADAFLAWL